jgi:hypothetical protein
VQEPTGPHQHQPSPHTARNCNLCASLRHPGMAAQGRALTKHLAANPFPKRAVQA